MSDVEIPTLEERVKVLEMQILLLVEAGMVCAQGGMIVADRLRKLEIRFGVDQNLH